MDASYIGIGAILLKEEAAGDKRPVALQAGNCNLVKPSTLRLNENALP